MEQKQCRHQVKQHVPHKSHRVQRKGCGVDCHKTNNKRKRRYWCQRRRLSVVPKRRDRRRSPTATLKRRDRRRSPMAMLKRHDSTNSGSRMVTGLKECEGLPVRFGVGIDVGWSRWRFGVGFGTTTVYLQWLSSTATAEASSLSLITTAELNGDGGWSRWLRWKENKKQEFSVKSAYQVALRINRAEVVEHSLAWEDKKLWNKALVRGKLQKCGAAASNFHLLARQMVAKLTRPELELWATVSWSIWNARNRYHFEAKQSQPSDILRGATSLLQDYQRLNRSLARP
uniref:Uncharacterized protein n=1 Tax=Quercus lobata TaxID=97700 RepID=A0A7N2LR74_QUELO